jgi:hypothetical protein
MFQRLLDFHWWRWQCHYALNIFPNLSYKEVWTNPSTTAHKNWTWKHGILTYVTTFHQYVWPFICIQCGINATCS